MGALGQEQKVGKLFEAAGYEVLQAAGPDAGVTDWFATPRAGLSRPRTYFVAWERCPEALPEALAELERGRTARKADKALGVVMEGRLPEGYKTDFGRGTEVVTYRRLALEVTGIAERVREQVRAYEIEEGPSLYLPLPGKIESGEIVDAAAYIRGWASEETTDSLVVIYPLRSSRLTPFRQAAYEVGVQFCRDPDRVVPLVRHEPADAVIAYDAGFAIPMVKGLQPIPLEVMRKVVLMPDVDPDDDHEGRRLEVMPPSSSELEGWLRDHLDEHVYARFRSARGAEPALATLSDDWNNMWGLIVSMRAAPSSDRMSTAEWIAHVMFRYMASIPMATLDHVEAMVFSQYALGADWEMIGTGDYFASAPFPPAEWVDNWDAFFEGEELVLNRLVRDYFLARRIGREVDSGKIEILTRYHFPETYVLLFLAIISPAAAARAAEIRAQIESEVERRVQLTLAHQLKRSVGAIRMNLNAVREDLTSEQEAAHRYELDRIEEELRLQSALAEHTGRWQSVPNGPEEAVVLREAVSAVVAPLAHEHPSVRLEIDLDAELRVRARPAVLREILHCLLENAFHAVLFPAVPDPVIRMTARAVEETFVVEISDNGRGVPAVDRERIFEPFVTTKKGGEQPHGTGMGLAIARRWAKDIGADVGLEAERATTCFFVRLVAWRNVS